LTGAKPAKAPARNALTVDVEDYYQVIVFQKGIERKDWPSFESRVERNTDQLLEAFERRSARATFFCLGCVAEKHPALVKRIAAAGHEIGSHGFDHEPVHRMEPAAFREDVAKTRKLLEDLSGAPVMGFRAPSFSITRKTLWALDELLDAGYAYDSSIFPIRRPDYGIPGAPRQPYLATSPSGRTIAELPLTVASFLGRAIPVSGGGYFRLFPFAITRWGLSKANREGRPAVFYMHPWEIDSAQPDLRSRTSSLGAFRHYVGLKGAPAKLDRLLAEFSFGAAKDVLAAHGLLPAQEPVGAT
jgi:polysaccharide deacetylase family protein (PEP-CTERM system associated)